jgi:hypothetical protein
MTHTSQVTASLKAIPAHKWRRKVGQLVIAAGLAALLYFIALPQKWPSTLILAIAGAIGYCVSADVMTALVKFLVAAIRDILAAIKNGKGDGPPAV